MDDWCFIVLSIIFYLGLGKVWQVNPKYITRNLINNLAPVEGLQTKFKHGNLLDIAHKLFEISKSGLEKRNIQVKNEKYNETFYLKDLEKNLSNGHSPADLLTSKYNGKWKKNIKKIYEEEIF